MSRSSKLYNKDLAPTPSKDKKWGWFEIFNVWANDVQSLFGYTLAASLFLASGLNGWAVFLALILAGFFIMWLVNLSGKPSVKHGIPYPVFARVSMGVFWSKLSSHGTRTCCNVLVWSTNLCSINSSSTLNYGSHRIKWKWQFFRHDKYNVDFIYICFTFPSIFILARNRFN